MTSRNVCAQLEIIGTNLSYHYLPYSLYDHVAHIIVASGFRSRTVE